jgi:hypothetical protein
MWCGLAVAIGAGHPAGTGDLSGNLVAAEGSRQREDHERSSKPRMEGRQNQRCAGQYGQRAHPAGPAARARELSPYGLRALSRRHADQPFTLHLAGARYAVDYEPSPACSAATLNWRGPIWFPVNYLVIEALHTYARFGFDRPRRRERPPPGLRRRQASSRPTGTGATCCPSTSTSTVTPAGAPAPATRRAGRRWSPASSFAPPITAPLGTVMTGYRGLDVCCMGSPPRPARAAPRPVPVAQVQPADAAGHRPRA